MAQDSKMGADVWRAILGENRELEELKPFVAKYAMPQHSHLLDVVMNDRAAQIRWIIKRKLLSQLYDPRVRAHCVMEFVNNRRCFVTLNILKDHVRFSRRDLGMHWPTHVLTPRDAQDWAVYRTTGWNPAGYSSVQQFRRILILLRTTPLKLFKDYFTDDDCVLKPLLAHVVVDFNLRPPQYSSSRPVVNVSRVDTFQYIDRGLILRDSPDATHNAPKKRPSKEAVLWWLVRAVGKKRLRKHMAVVHAICTYMSLDWCLGLVLWMNLTKTEMLKLASSLMTFEDEWAGTGTTDENVTKARVLTLAVKVQPTLKYELMKEAFES